MDHGPIVPLIAPWYLRLSKTVASAGRGLALFELDLRENTLAGPGSQERRGAAPHFADVRSLFPRTPASVPDLAARNAAFRSLCHDYERMADALRRLEIRNHPLDVERMYEYRRALRNLEARLTREFHKMPGRHR